MRTFQRKPISKAQAQTTPQTTPPIVHEVLRSSGQPLDATTKGFMESRFAHDFSKVRVHTDPIAARSALSVNALAYALGQNIVFGAGQYAPETVSGRRLLAHELAHTIQQSSFASPAATDTGIAPHNHPTERAADVAAEAALHGQPHSLPRLNAPMLARQAIAEGDEVVTEPPAEVTVGAPWPQQPYVCGPFAREILNPAIQRSFEWLGRAIRQLSDYVNATPPDGDDHTRTALLYHFHTTSPTDAGSILTRLQLIDLNMRSAVMSGDCRGIGQPGCTDPDVLAFWNRGANHFTFCGPFFAASLTSQATTIIHEMAHSLSMQGERVRDRGYNYERVINYLSYAEALTNAESYAMLVEELGAGRRVVPDTPVDPTPGCSDDLREQVHAAIARAQQWNRLGREEILRAPTERPVQWVQIRNRFLGPTWEAERDALAAFQRLDDSISHEITFTCEGASQSRCGAGVKTFWDSPTSALHICPTWMGLSSDEQIVSLLAGLYGQRANVQPDALRFRYAHLVKELNRQIAP
jgi:hypothetical protein